MMIFEKKKSPGYSRPEAEELAVMFETSILSGNTENPEYPDDEEDM